MKEFLKKVLIIILTIEAKLILRRYRPKIVAVSGTVGKTSTKEAIATALFSDFNVRKSEKSYNNELGIPLTIIKGKCRQINFFTWISVLFKGLKLLIANHDYPECLVLEIGVDRPGDMKKITSWIRPDIVVITALGEIPVHVEYFEKPESLAKEKAKLIQAVNSEGWIILNNDDSRVAELGDKAKSNLLTYGFLDDDSSKPDTPAVDLLGSNYRIMYRADSGNTASEKLEIPEGITFKVDYRGNIVPIRLFDTFGKQSVYAVLAALAVGSALDLNLIEMAERLSRYNPQPGRLKLIKGIKNSSILDDSYNSSPIAVKAALEVINDLPAKRKIVVLGDMLELGKYTIDEHKKVGREVSKVADLLFVVGPRSKFISEEARLIGFDPKKIFEFSDSDEAKIPLQEIINEGDLILVKGSRALRMEKIVEEIMAEPNLKDELIVQEK